MHALKKKEKKEVYYNNNTWNDETEKEEEVRGKRKGQRRSSRWRKSAGWKGCEGLYIKCKYWEQERKT